MGDQESKLRDIQSDIREQHFCSSVTEAAEEELWFTAQHELTG